MTKERAIQVLKEMKKLTGVATDSRCRAIDMAIESLSESEDVNKVQTPAEPSDIISRTDAIEVGNKIVEELSLSSIDWDDLKYWAKELFDALPSADRQTEYNLETIADIVRQLGHLDDYVADICDRPKGEWIVENHEVVCSVCGQNNLETNFCPNCGADMRCRP